MENIPQIEDRMAEFFKQEKYRSLIGRSAAQRSTSIPLDFSDLMIFDERLSHLIVDEPLKYIPLLEKAAWDQLRIEDPVYAGEVKEFKLRIYNLPEVILIRDIRASHLRKLIAVDGLIVRATAVKPIIRTAVFKCRVCGSEQTIPQNGQRLVLPESCNSIKCRGKRQRFELIEEKSEYYDYQVIGIQEKPEDLPPGQLPRSIEAGLKGDLVDRARPGDRVIVTGVLYAVQEKTGEAPLRTSKMYLEAVSIETAGKEPETLQITLEEEKMFREMASKPDIHQKIIESIAPSIYGLNHIKKAIMLLLFGGRTKQFPDGVKVRGDIHILLVGDPGTGKSQLLRYAAQIAPRGIYTSGRGSTAAGLTAAVVRDKGGNMILEAGALVLADMGLCCLAPETKIISDRGIVTLQKLAEQVRFSPAIANGVPVELAPLQCKVPCLDLEGMRVVMAKSTLIRRKLYRGRVLNLIMKSGNTIRLTPEHLLLDGVSLRWRTAEEFQVGEKLISLIKLSSSYESTSFWRTISEKYEGRKYNNGLVGANPSALILAQSVEDLREGNDRLEIDIDNPRDLLLDEIVDIWGEDYDGYVYDLYVPVYHNFVANGIIVHNCIDEIDKMRPEDRVAIHEAMAQQTVSIAKGGIVATLNARTSILAAANPELGRYNPYESFTVNVNLPITILSRFDLIFVLRDEPIPEQDQKIASHILSLQSRSVSPTEPILKPEILRKYIAYSKRIQPELTPRAAKLIEGFYLQMRNLYQQTSTITITARQLESLIRMAEARARAALRDYVTEEDVLDVIELMKRSLSEVGIDIETGKLDIDVILTGKPKSMRDKFATVLKIIGEIQEKKGYVEDAELREALREQGIEDHEIKMLLNRLLSDGKLYTPKPGVYRLV
ncbi:MAG: hypothetical protein ABDH32_02440 [Candidatus Caldarchaeales archaeon]